MQDSKKPSIAIAYSIQKKNKKRSDSRQSAPMTDSDDMSPPMSMADAIMRKRKAKKMAEGGMVEADTEETPASLSPYDDENEDAIKKELYGLSDMDSQPEDSNEHGDDIEADVEDRISAVRRKMRARLSSQG